MIQTSKKLTETNIYAKKIHYICTKFKNTTNYTKS
jgi:hypothetical protein